MFVVIHQKTRKTSTLEVGSWARECRWPARPQSSEKSLDSSLAEMLSDNFLKPAGLRAELRSQSAHFCSTKKYFFLREVFGATRREVSKGMN